MRYYFLKNVSSEYGPINFFTYGYDSQPISELVDREAESRGLMMCHEYEVETLSREEYKECLAAPVCRD